LDFLLGVMNDPAATPRQRVKAACVAARYKHAYPSRPKARQLTPNEDVEAAHLAASVVNPVAKPKPIKWFFEVEWSMTRMVELEELLAAGDRRQAH
jgi:hypothetical protein